MESFISEYGLDTIAMILGVIFVNLAIGIIRVMTKIQIVELEGLI